MYGGLGKRAIMQRKNIPENEVFFDRMGTTELAANAFRLTQARDQLEEQGVNDQATAIKVNKAVGKKVRDAIIKIGGTLPEDLPAEEHIKNAKKRVKAATPQIELEERDATGLSDDSGLFDHETEF